MKSSEVLPNCSTWSFVMSKYEISYFVISTFPRRLVIFPLSLFALDWSRQAVYRMCNFVHLSKIMSTKDTIPLKIKRKKDFSFSSFDISDKKRFHFQQKWFSLWMNAVAIQLSMAHRQGFRTGTGCVLFIVTWPTELVYSGF